MLSIINLDYNEKEDAVGWIEYCINYSIGMMYVSLITWTIRESKGSILFNMAMSGNVKCC